MGGYCRSRQYQPEYFYANSGYMRDHPLDYCQYFLKSLTDYREFLTGYEEPPFRRSWQNFLTRIVLLCC
jgi:hypothetical protein